MKFPLWNRATLFSMLAMVMATACPSFVHAQGCVASRGGSCVLPGQLGILPGQAHDMSGFQASVGYRWLHSDRHFVGDEEQKERQKEGSEVINNSHFMDLTLSYTFTPRLSASLTVPFSVHDRSQVVRSNDLARSILGRFHTQSAGVGDLRLMGNGWILDPMKARKGNVLLGVGLDMPTGEKDAKDTFQIFDPATKQVVARERTVDQSIQPGDGGWGAVLEIYAFQEIFNRCNAYLNGSYLITPEEDNGVLTYRSNPYEAIMSIPDTYFGRVGLEYLLWPQHGLTVSLGGRIEGVPVRDLIGGSDGFRRPGFSVAIEPGISASIKSWSVGVTAPVALYRNRERSVPDEQQARATGVPRHGDAAFADFLLLLTVSKRF